MKSLLEGTALCREKQDLSESLIALIIDELFDDAIAIDAKADFLRAHIDKGETAGELAAFVRMLLPRAVDPGFSGTWNGRALLDCCGTGGGGLPIFNVSTGIVFILAALGVPVVKHGNRGLTKKSGSADVLETLGIRIDLTPEQIRRSLDEIGAAFFFAPRYHPSFAHIAPVRKLLGAEGRRTIFNGLGPILNPARPDAQIIGVFQQNQLALYDDALSALGRKRHVIIWGRDMTQNRAIGEVSVTGPNQFQGNVALEATAITPVSGDLHELEVTSAKESAAKIVAILDGSDTGLGRALLAANATVALATQGGAASLPEAFSLVNEAIDSRRALQKLRAWQEV